MTGTIVYVDFGLSGFELMEDLLAMLGDVRGPGWFGPDFGCSAEDFLGVDGGCVGGIDDECNGNLDETIK